MRVWVIGSLKETGEMGGKNKEERDARETDSKVERERAR